MSETGMSAKDLAKEMGDDLSGEIKTYIKTCENGIYSTDGFKKAIGELSIADKAANVAFKGLMIAGNLLASMLASVLLTTIYKCITANSQLQKSAREIGQSFSESKSEIDDYQKKISELRDKINDSSSSYEETYQARENLLEIQDQMIAKFGSEADAIKNVTDAINGSDDAFKKLTRSEVDKAITKFNLGSDQSLAGTFANWWGHATKGYSSNWDTMLGDMENYTAQFRVEPHLDDKAYKEFEEKVKELFGGTRDRYDNGDDFIEISGNLDEVNHKLQGILALARDLGVDNSYISGLENAVNKTQNLYDSYKDIYDMHILNDKIFANDDYEKAFSSIQDGYKTYQEEYKKGNQDAASDFVKTFNEATQNIDDEEIKKYFRRLYPDLQAEIGGWQFEVKFKAALADDSDNYEQNIQDALSKFDSVNAIEDYSPTSASTEQKEAYRVLQLAADKYDMSITQLIEHLSQMGYIASRTKNDLLHKLGGGTSPKGDTIGAFGMIIPSQEEMNAVSDEVKDWVTDLTEEQAKLANSKEFEKAVKERKQEIAGLSDAQANLRDEYKKIHDWRLDDYSEEIKNGTLPSKYGNIDMDNRTVIKYDENYLKEHENVLKSWVEEYDEITGEPIYTKYNEVADAIANGESLIDSVWGQSDRFGEDLNGVGWEIAFTPILPNGNFLSSDTVYDYIDSILKDAYANDGQVTADELTKLDAKGRMIGNTFVHGIFAAVDDSQNYDDNGNWADTVGRLMHFAGDDGAIKLATKAIDQANEAVRNGTLSAEDYAIVLEIVQKRLEKVSETNTDVPKSSLSLKVWISLIKFMPMFPIKVRLIGLLFSIIPILLRYSVI